MNALSEFSQGIRGELLLGASTLPGEYLLPQWMGDFNKEHPRFNLSLKIADTQKIVQEVLEGNVEFGVIGAKVKHPFLHYEKIEEDEIIVVGSMDHPTARKKGMDLERLAGEPWIIREEGSGTRIAVENALRKKGRSLKEFNVKVELGSTSSVKEGVKARLGFAFLSRKSVEEELNQGVLSRVDVEGMDPILRQIYLVTHRRKTLSPMGMAFLRFLKRKGRGEKP
jgi:DNA-binding transcriptional LysR family regulator